jgi:hypothetical protein
VSVRVVGVLLLRGTSGQDAVCRRAEGSARGARVRYLTGWIDT